VEPALTLYWFAMPGFNIGQNNQAAQPGAAVESARQHRWKFATLDPLKDILIYAHKSGRPKVEFDRAQLHHSQDVLWFPGKQKWLPIDVSFYHIITNTDSAYKIYQWWSTRVVNLASSTINIVKQACTLELLNGEGTSIYKYTMYGCWPSKITPDELDYASSKVGEITFTLEMDKAKEENLQEAE
jgi:hypothetical protein